jgi:hypothetical protein
MDGQRGGLLGAQECDDGVEVVFVREVSEAHRIRYTQVGGCSSEQGGREETEKKREG